MKKMIEGERSSLPAKRTVIVLVILCILFVLILVRVNDFSRSRLVSTKGQSYERAVVTEITWDNLNEDGNRYGNQEVRVKIQSGALKGKVVNATSPSGNLFGAACKKGMHVIVIVSKSKKTNVVTVYSYNRVPVIFVFIFLFCLAVCLIGGKKGIMAILSLAFAFVGIFYLMFPAVYRGASPILMAVLISVLTTIVTLGLLNGLSRKTLAAVIGTASGVIIAGIAAALFGHFAQISGYNVSQIETLSFVGQHSSIRIGELLFAGIIIAALGAVMDVGMSLASATEEIHLADPSMNRSDLFRAGLRVGKDMMGTMTNTLILAYVGGSLVTLIINYAYNLSFNQLANSYIIGIEIMQSFSGSFGVVLTVPITAFVSAVLCTRKKEEGSKGERVGTAG